MIIYTKLEVPPVKAGLLPRTKLINQLSANRGARLISIVAPAGSGKTSLISDWIARENLRALWYSLDKNDDDENTFLTYLLTVLSRAHELPSSQALPVHDEQEMLSGKKVLPYLIDRLKDLSEDTYLVMDDYHNIKNPKVYEPMTRFIEYLPPKMHLIVMSRHALPFATPRLRMRGLMEEIGSVEMKLSQKETERFFAEIFDLKLSVGQLQEVARHMEGWMGGLQLLGLALKGGKQSSSIPDALYQADQLSQGYLIHEVIDSQADRIKAFLETTALLDRFTVNLCTAVTGLSDAPELLDYALKNNLFLGSLDSRQKWFRYHHLFSAAVRKRCRTTRPKFYKEIHKIAAQWFLERNLIEDGFRHAFTSGDLEFAADMLEDHLKRFYDEGNIMLFRRWFYRLPRKIVESRALLMLLEAYHKMDTGDFAGAARILADVESRKTGIWADYADHKKKLCEEFLGAFEKLLPYLSNVVDADIGQLRKAIRNIPSGHSAFRRFAFRIVPLVCSHQVEVSLAQEALHEMSSGIFSEGRPQDCMGWFGQSARVERIQGHLSQAERIAKRALVFFQQKPSFNDSFKFGPQIHLAWVHYLRNDLAQGMVYLSPAIKSTERNLFLYDLIDALHLASLLSTVKGEYNEAARWARRLERCMEMIGTAGAMEYINAHIARLSVIRGELGQAEERLKGMKIDLAKPFRFHSVMKWLAYIEVMHGLGSYREALRTIEAVRLRCSDHKMFEPVLDLDILRAASLWSLRRHSEAVTVAKEALTFGSKEHYIRPFADHATIIAPILREVPAGYSFGSRNGALYFDSVRKACGVDTGEAHMEPSTQMWAEQLTRREADILRLLANGLKDREIAEKMFISIHTVQTHTKHIFGKLGVNTRVQAVRRAETLGYLQ